MQCLRGGSQGGRRVNDSVAERLRCCVMVSKVSKAMTYASQSQRRQSHHGKPSGEAVKTRRKLENVPVLALRVCELPRKKLEGSIPPRQPVYAHINQVFTHHTTRWKHRTEASTNPHLSTSQWRQTAPPKPHPQRQQYKKARNQSRSPKSAAPAHENIGQQHIPTSKASAYDQTAPQTPTAMALSDRLRREKHAALWWT